jgi:hypothetical protein
MRGNLSRRLTRLEARAAVVTEMNSHAHTIVFVAKDKTVTGAIRWDRDKHAWTKVEIGPGMGENLC